jgi:hypothetical protein
LSEHVDYNNIPELINVDINVVCVCVCMCIVRCVEIGHEYDSEAGLFSAFG